MAMLLNSQYSDAHITADVLLGEELLDDGVQADLKKLNDLVAARKRTGRAITPADLVGDGPGIGGGDNAALKAADKALGKLLANRARRR
jgi:hypothetical protein